MPLIRFLADFMFRRHCPNVASGEAAIETWKTLPLELASNLRPFKYLIPIEPLPANLETDYHSDQTEDIVVSDNHAVSLDVVVGDEQNLVNARHAVQAFRQGNHTKEHFLQMTPIWFIQAGHACFRSGQYDRALRCFLNACRLEPPVGDIIAPEMRRNIGKCVLNLGDFQNAGVEYLLAAEKFLAEAKSEDSAQCFEMSVICWEASNKASRHQIGTENGDYDSTICSRKAKFLYLNIGDYISASRCSILEQDCHLRWNPRLSRVPRWAMRLVWLYGESPLYVMRCVVLFLLIVGTILFYFGYNRSNTEVRYCPGFSVSWQSCADFGDALYLAVVTVTTLGYGDLSPSSAISKLAAGVASFSGIMLAAMFMVALQRRYVGR